ncbi:hypothetical protein [Candidatus Odyssella acanthamoebae]|uniref:Uncharacterized protein n=1 Tax=Candidatus Odyssella acanthamoebae TaxID=91604 RepID=A0A077ATA5_9PROT|nr:hypothetical protein [Candidatus Paracaedibacter acanthamoebae]AIK96412.1 hypothetical protein ID47_06170 [Candidatus Paracaedibacter acanthamoebae]
MQELVPLALGQFRRTVNGDLVFLGTNGKKYKSTISCEDKTVIATDRLDVGGIVDVSCIQRLWQRCEGNRVTLDRLPAAGSVHVIDEHHSPLYVAHIEGREITIDSDQPCFVSYRPLLTMRIVRYVLKTDEWGVKTGWQMELEEV